MQLIDGQNGFEGRVEICYEEAFGTVCSDGFGTQEASVVCRQLGYSAILGNDSTTGVHCIENPFSCAVVAVSTSSYGAGTGTVYLDSLSCVGNESSLLECGRGGEIGSTLCSHTQDVGVVCQRRASKHNSSKLSLLFLYIHTPIIALWHLSIKSGRTYNLHTNLVWCRQTLYPLRTGYGVTPKLGVNNLPPLLMSATTSHYIFGLVFFFGHYFVC